MLTGIDHLVVVVPELEAAIRSYERLGFTVVRGGRHPVGTHNALISFSDGAYLELIAFYEPNPDHRWWTPLQRGGGLVDFCMQTDSLPADTAALREAGVRIDAPTPLSRVRPDGYRLSWVLSIPRGPHRGVAPFLIEDETPREERVPRQMTHSNGASGIGTLTVAVDEIRAAGGWYRGVLREAGTAVLRDDLEAAGARFTIGPHTLEVVAPAGARGPVAEWLGARGPSPYAATLGTTGAQRGSLDPTLTLGARLSWA